MKALLLDTCIWLDTLEIGRPYQAASNKLVELCFSRDIPMLYSVTSIQNIEYLMQATLKNSYRKTNGSLTEASARAIQVAALASIDNIFQIASAVGADQSDIWLARKFTANHSDFEDCMILAAMERSQASFLVTHDADLIDRSPYPTMTAENMLAYLEARPGWEILAN